MNGKTVYLDSSAIAKRYVAEEGTESVDLLYRRAESREIQLAFSLWNVGEVLRALARAEEVGWISEAQVSTAGWSFVQETLKVHALGALRTVPVRGDLLAEAVPLLFRYRVSQPDALQVTTCKDVRADALISADRRLLQVARAEGLLALDPKADESRIRSL